MSNIISTLTSKNQITIPKAVRQGLGLVNDGEKMEFIESDEGYLIKRYIETKTCPICKGHSKFKGKRCLFCCEGVINEPLSREFILMRLSSIIITITGELCVQVKKVDDVYDKIIIPKELQSEELLEYINSIQLLLIKQILLNKTIVSTDIQPILSIFNAEYQEIIRSQLELLV